MGSAERIQTFILIGLAGVFILLAIGLGINWLTGHEAHRSLILMILGGLLLCASLIWIRRKGLQGEKCPAVVVGSTGSVARAGPKRFERKASLAGN